MVTVVGVRFKKAGKIYYFDPGNFVVQKWDKVIVETARGTEFGEVVVGPKFVPEDDVVQPLKAVVRIATPEDEARVQENQERASHAFKVGVDKITEHSLPMKLIDVEYTFDDSKLIFYFTADGRVDFRELVKDLAAIFKTRIELRQIGVRDEAKMLGGLGPCGRSLCCATFLGDFDPVSIRMAKEQNLSLNPSKISGICGRLMCCLKYESEVYKDCKSDKCHGKCPKIPDDVESEDELRLLEDDVADYYDDLVLEDKGDSVGKKSQQKKEIRPRQTLKVQTKKEPEVTVEPKDNTTDDGGPKKRRKRRSRKRKKPGNQTKPQPVGVEE